MAEGLLAAAKETRQEQVAALVAEAAPKLIAAAVPGLIRAIRNAADVDDEDDDEGTP